MVQIVLCALLAAAPATAVVDPDAGAGLSYVYQRGDHGAQGTGTVEADVAAGTREVRPFGSSGVESGARFKFNALDRVAIEGWGGALVSDGTYVNAAWSAEVSARILEQSRHFVNLSLGAGFMRDYQSVSIPRARVTLGRTFGRVDTSLSGLFELPQAASRDGVDVILGAAASYRVSRTFAVGAEVLGEDLEGLWNAKEAEGGAKLVAGPTVWFKPAPSFHLKLNAAAVVSATQSTNAPAGAGPGIAPAQPAGTGFLGRIVAGFDF